MKLHEKIWGYMLIYMVICILGANLFCVDPRALCGAKQSMQAVLASCTTLNKLLRITIPVTCYPRCIVMNQAAVQWMFEMSTTVKWRIERFPQQSRSPYFLRQRQSSLLWSHDLLACLEPSTSGGTWVKHAIITRTPHIHDFARMSGCLMFRHCRFLQSIWIMSFRHAKVEF